jgi:hypothetical protein
MVTYSQTHEPGYDIIDVFASEALANEHLAVYKHITGDDEASLIEYEINNHPPQIDDMVAVYIP